MARLSRRRAGVTGGVSDQPGEPCVSEIVEKQGNDPADSPIIAIPAQFGREGLLSTGQVVRLAHELQAEIDQHKATQAKLDEMQQQSELILSSAGEGILGLDREGRIIFENCKAAELLGREPNELLGKPAHETIHYKHADGREYLRADCPICSTIATGGTRQVSDDILWHKDGACFRVDYTVAPMKSADGCISGAIVTFRDGDNQAAAEARAKLQEEQYRLLFKTNPNPMWVFDTSRLRILAVNNAAITEYGYTREEFLQLSLPDLRPPADRAKLLEALSDAAARAHFSGQYQHLRKDGSQLHVDIYSSPVVWDSVAARMVTAINCTERKETEVRLRRQAEMLDRAHDAISMRRLDDHRITFWNKGAERLYGWTATEAIGCPLFESIVAPAELAKATQALVESGEFRGETSVVTKDGRRVTVAVRSTLVDDSDGRDRFVLSIHTDITAQKKLEMQLLRAQRLESIGTLASGVAHDLNNIITPILMSALMLREPQDDETREKLLELVEESAHRGAKLVSQVLTFARGMEGERVLLQPRHLINEVAKIASQTFPKNIAVRTSYNEDIWPVVGDATQLHQVLLNLSVNARDAMPNGGALTLAADNFTVDPSFAAIMPGASAGPHVLLMVTDSGTGIPRDVVDKIFDPFFTTKEVGKGTGLGLSTALGIVKSHGGFLNVYSEPGEGATFKIFLPAAPQVEQQRATPIVEHRFDGKGETILVIDDEEPIRRVTQTMLSQHNYRVLTAGDGPEALALFAQHMEKVHVVLTDLSMPHMDGVTLAYALKKMKAKVHVIASTGRSDDPRISELDAAGVAACLSKPYDSARLLEALHRVLAPG